MKKNLITVINIYKTGGVISDPSDAFDAHTERPSAPVIVRKAALLVSALWCLLTLPLTFASCADDEAPFTPKDADTRTATPDAATDSTATLGGEITAWEEREGTATPVR